MRRELTREGLRELMEELARTAPRGAAYSTLWPMTRRERLGQGRAGSWTELFDHRFEEWPAALSAESSVEADWREVVRAGGYPVPSVRHTDPDDRAIWFDGYVRTYLERDLQDLSAIDNLIDFRRLMRALSHRLGKLVNQSEIGRDIQLPQPTVRRWMNLLETSYQLVPLPAFAINRTKRLIKSPKAYWSDTGLALRLAGDPEPDGHHLENLVLMDLLVWQEQEVLDRPALHYWRTTNGEEVDFVIERGGDLVAVEVKATTKPRASDAKHLLAFQEEYRDAARGCLLLHGGSEMEWVGARTLAVPWWRVL